MKYTQVKAEGEVVAVAIIAVIALIVLIGLAGAGASQQTQQSRKAPKATIAPPSQTLSSRPETTQLVLDEECPEQVESIIVMEPSEQDSEQLGDDAVKLGTIIEGIEAMVGRAVEIQKELLDVKMKMRQHKVPDTSAEE